MTDIWASLLCGATKCRNNPQQSLALEPGRQKESAMIADRETISTGPSADPLKDTIAGTGPGIPDDSLAPGEDALPEAPSDEEVERAARALGAPTAEKDSLPLEGE
jgi:hypothetical protein